MNGYRGTAHNIVYMALDKLCPGKVVSLHIDYEPTAPETKNAVKHMVSRHHSQK